MEYCFQLYPFANIKYREALTTLARAELLCLLETIGISAKADLEIIGGCSFLTADTDSQINEKQLRMIARHSALLMFCAREKGLLRPLLIEPADYFPPDLPEILKYKGKTAVPFTNMLITLAWAASDFFGKEQPVTVLDPVCGRGTSLFAALQRGMHAIGLDADASDVQQADRFLEQYLKLGRYKHTRKAASLTHAGKGIPQVMYEMANTKEAFQQGDTRKLTLLTADTASAGNLLKKNRAEILVADLPYGIQHAPVSGKKTESFEVLLSRCLPSWREALVPGGAMAVSFNTLTLKKKRVVELLEAAGWTPLTEAPWDDFLHPVEQAVERDLVVARR